MGIIKPMHQVKINAIDSALEHCQGNKIKTAKALQISIRHIRNMVKKHAQLAKWRRKPRIPIAQRG